jgi:hypothetical protein
MKSFRSLVSVLALVLLPMALAQAGRTEIPNAIQPQLATGTDGRVWLVYSQAAAAPGGHAKAHDHHAGAAEGKSAESKKGRGGHGPAGRAGDVFVASSKDGGGTFAPAVKVAHVPQLMLGNRRGPRIVAQGDRVTVTAIAHELIAFTSNDGGRTWSGPVTVNDVPNSAHEGLHDLAGSRDGELFVTWLDLRNGKTELWGSRSKDGGRSWAKNALVYKSPDKSICECCHPSALFDAEGNLAVMWRNSIEGARDMWLITQPKGTAAFTTPRKLGEGTWKINGCPHDGGTLIALGGGKFGAVWQRAGEVFLIRSEGVEVNLGKGRQPVAFMGPGGPAVVWQEGTGLVTSRDSKAGSPTRHASEGRFPVVAAAPGGKGAVIAYERGPNDGASVVVERLN